MQRKPSAWYAACRRGVKNWFAVVVCGKVPQNRAQQPGSPTDGESTVKKQVSQHATGRSPPRHEAQHGRCGRFVVVVGGGGVVVGARCVVGRVTHRPGGGCGLRIRMKLISVLSATGKCDSERDGWYA
jgi:hypothetical protein